MIRRNAAIAFLVLPGAAALCCADVSNAAKDTVRVNSPLTSIGDSLQETSLGDLLADAVRSRGQADFAVVPAEELKETTIPAGDIPTAQFVSTLRFADDTGDTVVVMKIKGAQLTHAAERSVSRSPIPFDGFLQVSGLRMTYRIGQSGDRSVAVTMSDGAQISPTATYTVATTLAIAEGNLGYYQVWDRHDIAQDTQETLADGFGKYLAEQVDIDRPGDQRIVRQQ